MSEVSESRRESSPLLGVLRDGIEQLDFNQEIEFKSYTRVVLPLDGYMFWSPKVPIVRKGSLHYSQDILQNEDEMLGYATVIFTSERRITEFTGGLNTLFVACIDGFRYSFSQQQGFYTQAGLWHYVGHSIPPALASQLLDTPGVIDPTQAVVSNSLPLWIALNTYKNPYFDGFNNSGLILYPSFITAPNLSPPYGAVHIGENDTSALQSVPLIDADRNHYQLASDQVRITLYGLQNNAAMDFIDFVLQYSRNTENFGIMNMPIMRDAKRTQAELQVIAMKKVIDFTVSYYQARVANVSRQLIESAPIDYIPEANPL